MFNYGTFLEDTASADIAQTEPKLGLTKKCPKEDCDDLDESPVGKVGRTGVLDAKAHVSDTLRAQFKKIVKQLGGKTVARQLLAEMNSGIVESYSVSWVGGPDDYKTIDKIAEIIASYDFYSNRIDNGAQHRAAVADNKKKAKELKKLGVTAWRGEEDDAVINRDGFKEADKKDIKTTKIKD